MNMSVNMSVDKQDPSKDDRDSEDSMESSPEGEEAPPVTTTQQNQQPKRKGGRKPIYATSEERKQRNRQAQAAFRERRTEYIKQLEEAIRTHEQHLANLQAAHRQAADECLMLRYKNSLLERILLEKGIDVQAELRAKTNSPSLGPTHMPQNMVQPPPIQRAILNRHHARRSNSSIAPKLEPGVSPLPPPMHGQLSVASPKSRPTPSSHSASPSATTSYGSQHGASPASSDHLSASMRPLSAATSMKPPMHGLPGLQGQRHLAMAGLQQPGTAGHQRQNMPVSTAPPFYVAPSFQNHIEQLGKLPQQEYDAAADMMDDSADPPDTPGPGPYPGQPYSGEPSAMSLPSPVTTGPPSQQATPQSPMEGISHAQHPAYPSMTQLLDPGYDFDPFGLSASMAFPTQFSFDTSNMR